MKPLTIAQARILQRIATNSDDGMMVGNAAFELYRAPMRRLLKRGLIERRPHKNPKYRSEIGHMFITPAGRRALDRMEARR